MVLEACQLIINCTAKSHLQTSHSTLTNNGDQLVPQGRQNVTVGGKNCPVGRNLEWIQTQEGHDLPMTSWVREEEEE